MLTRKDKQELICKYKADLSKSKFSFVFRCQGINVQEMDKIRHTVKSNECKVAFTKNTLAKLAVQNTDHIGLEALFKGVSILAVHQSMNEDVYPASIKAILPFLKQYRSKFELAGGVLNGSFMNSKQLEEFGKMPSRLELLSTFAMYCKYPLMKFNHLIKSIAESKS